MKALVLATATSVLFLQMPALSLQQQNAHASGAGAISAMEGNAGAEKHTGSSRRQTAGQQGTSFAERLGASLSRQLAGGSVAWALMLAFLGGVLTSLMGCVYPLIPIAMAVIGTRETRSRWGALGLSAVYVGGMCLLYTSLGLVFAALGKAFGSWMGNPWVVGLIAAVFVLMGLSMAGLFEFRLPAAVEARLNRAGGKGPAGAFLAGLVSGLVMAPCTGPVLSVVLVFIATTQSFFLGFWLLLFLSLGTGLLFLLIGTFSGLVGRLPRSGRWMEVIRSLFSMVMVGMGIFFLHGAWPALGMALESLPLVWVAAAALAAAAAVGGFHLSWPDGTAAQKARKLVGIAAGGFAVLCLAAAAFTGSAGKVGWHKDIEKGLAIARQRNRPAILDFWATWCPACIELDRKTFSDPRVSGELERRFVAIKIDCTSSAEDEDLEKVMEKYGAMDLPTIRFVDSKGRLLAEPVVKGFVPPERMLSILKSIE